ncbi:MAG: ABC transporter permease/substrate-binding protein [Planctomycetota bacterium]|nr:ABC transporter permease/substrate-binding protein [Planctomycetota bacterium]
MDQLTAELERLPELLAEHLRLSLSALGLGISIGIFLAILSTRFRRMQGPLLAVASVFQTIPSIALLAGMLLLIGKIGFIPALIALLFYSLLPVLRNTITGIENVDEELIEAGRGMGMTPGQLLRKVQIPLAFPVIIAGVRTATVWVVGIATLATPIGQKCLGEFIFSGLSTKNYTAVGVGVVSAAGLALILDGLIRLLELAASRRSRPLLITALLLLAAVTLGGLSPILLPSGERNSDSAIVVGGKDFTEQFILAEFIAEHLNESGVPARSLSNLGSTVAFDALTAGQIDCYVEYTGTIWSNYMNRQDTPEPEEALKGVRRWLKDEHDVELVGRLGFENAYALAMRGGQADESGIDTIAGLLPHAGDMRLGGSFEFFGRPEWKAIRNVYGLEFGDTVSMDPTLMYEAVRDEEVDVIAAFSTDGRIAAYELKVLDDPKHALPPYDAVLLVRSEAMDNAELEIALESLVGTIDDEAMREANKIVDVEGRPIPDAANALHEQTADHQQDG